MGYTILLAEDEPGLKTIRLTENYRSEGAIIRGAASVISRNPGGERILSPNRAGEDKIRLVQAAVCFLLLTVAWVFFRAESLGKAGEILGRIATMAGGVFPLGVTALGLSRARLLAVCLAAAALFVLEALGQKRPLTDRLGATVWPRYAVWVGLVLAIAVFGAYGAGYDAQEFVYFQF